MKISAFLQNGPAENKVVLKTNDREQTMILPSKAGGSLGINGGELLFTALAACFCNDIYREAARVGIQVEAVEVFVRGEFEDVGSAAANVSYDVKVVAAAPEAAVRELIQHTDQVLEIHKTVRRATPVPLGQLEIVSTTAA